MKKNVWIALAVASLPSLATAQFSVSGKINDKNSTTSLSGVSISVLKSDRVVQSAASGEYKLDNLKSGRYTVRVQYVGYKMVEQKLNLNKDLRVDFELERDHVETDNAFVTAINATNKANTNAPQAVAINGVPSFPHENQHSYFIAMPDFAYSVDSNNQIQRGIGIADNGSGSFGAFMNVQDVPRRDDAYAELNNTYGSLNTWRTSIKGGSGLINNKFSVDGRLSYINSDGYMTSGNSDVRSGFVSGAYHGAKSLLRANVFLGAEKTNEAWVGVPVNELLQANRKDNQFTYNGQTDNYVQSHYQLLYGYSFSTKVSLSSAAHYSRARGFYEENPFGDQVFLDYNIIAPTGAKGSLVRRRSLDTDFYGAASAITYAPQKDLKYTLGGSFGRYEGSHFGDVLWAQGIIIAKPHRYTNDDAYKGVYAAFGQVNYQLGKINLSTELQYRRVEYTYSGVNGSLADIQQQVHINAFNPKVGVNYQLTQKDQLQASFAISNIEPRREHYVNSTPDKRPQNQRLSNIRVGYNRKREKLTLNATAFGMFYKDQLVGLGTPNKVGEWVDQNVANSSRIGMELEGKVHILPQLTWFATAVVSKNRIAEFTDDKGKTYTNIAISASPSFVAASELAFKPFKKAEVAIINRYLGRQYRDNTANEDNSIKPFFVNDLRLSYTTSFKYLKNVGATLLVNNLFGTVYDANAANYNYVDKGFLVNKDYFFPQAHQKQNLVLGLNVKF